MVRGCPDQVRRCVVGLVLVVGGAVPDPDGGGGVGGKLDKVSAARWAGVWSGCPGCFGSIWFCQVPARLVLSVNFRRSGFRLL